MSFRINTNTASAFSSYQLQKGQRALSESLERLSTGKRINKASDDASGMVIANTLGSQARGYGQALRNSNDAIAITQVADGALGQASDILQNIRTKAIQAANGAQSAESRLAIRAGNAGTCGYGAQTDAPARAIVRRGAATGRDCQSAGHAS